jgi:dTMP kinase
VAGRFISFEGGERSGKSTQIAVLAERLRRSGLEPVLTREPGGTPLGEVLRDLLLHDQRAPRAPEAEALLYAAARAELVAAVIRPALAAGRVVISDRYVDSSLAYQAYGLGLDVEYVRAVNRGATGGLMPDLTILLLDADYGRDAPRDRIERRDEAFHRRVREGYLRLAAAEPQRFVVVEGRAPVEEVARRVWEAVRRLLGGDGP